MSDANYSIDARTPTDAIVVWTFTFAAALYGLIPTILFNIRVSAEGSALGWGIAQIAFAALVLAVFALYTRRRDDVSGGTPFTYSMLPWRRLYPAGLVSGYGMALLPLGLVWAVMGTVMVATGAGHTASSATATVASGTRVDTPIATWRVDTAAFHSGPRELVPVAEEHTVAAALGETVRLTGAWDGVTELTIESVTVQDFQGTRDEPPVAGAPLTYDSSCLIVTGSQRTSNGTLKDLHFFFTTTPGDSKVKDGKVKSDLFAAEQYTRLATEGALLGANTCPRGSSTGIGYRDITVDPEPGEIDGPFFVKFRPYSSVGSAFPSRYLGVQTADGTIVFWDTGE